MIGDINFWFSGLGALVLAAPLALCVLLGLSALMGRSWNEATVGRFVKSAVLTGLLASIAILALMLLFDTRHVQFELGNKIVVPQEHFHLTMKIVFDRLSVPFVILSFVLCGTIGVFANAYLHREPGYHRFFLLYSLFLLGMIVTSVAGTIEMLFAGWELVGLSSALLVAFFHERTAPVQNGLRVWTVYRVADAAFLAAAVALHHLSGEGDFVGLMADAPWPDGHAALTSSQALFVGLLLLIAAAGKSALAPFCGWLPRAMEGPTPSSAVFYGALSVHLGAFLLLRVSPVLELSGPLCAAVVAVGVATALLGAAAARVQTDIKSELSFASLTQVGIIVAEIGLGLRYIPLIHIIGHGCLRTLQILRAPSLLDDRETIENAVGSAAAPRRAAGRLLPKPLQIFAYRFLLQRGFLDEGLSRWVADPFLRLIRACDGWERRWTDLLEGKPNRAAAGMSTLLEPLDDLS